MTIERWRHTTYDGVVTEATITGDGENYKVDSSTEPSLFNIYKSYTWARKSLEKYGFELVETKIILGA